ncbi:DUF6492 family protein [Hansschlegelia plantiphila]|uniref:Uncharacterized protein n=1 Tax=Hansschlegelia plantiphila TaxID=374655 RepID=A0A9W6J3T3_9HYPH|nr:DUF6492 family protein [Hansschlegelia plantiphila]GLK68819.1 hypothetical protein GCM10008179_24570 [Hansschlegelia plantiphila]
MTLTARLSTCSFRGDFEACRALCDSVDRFVAEEIEHWLIVPGKDIALFAPLGGGRRRILAEEDFLPRGFWKAPMPAPKLRRLLRLPRRNIYFTPFSKPVRGWIAQQMMKISATASATTDIVVHVDSDNVFVRKLTLDHLAKDGRVRLYRSPVKVEQPGHRLWHAAAGRLLGLPPSDFYDAEYIDALVVWRRSALVAMTGRIERVTGSSWQVALARTPHFAEYVLYGVHADKVMGLDAAGLYAAPDSLCHSRWSGAFGGRADEDAFIAGIRPDHVSCLIQSTIEMSLEARLALYARAQDFAARQDAG